jgi:hypothetical protein
MSLAGLGVGGIPYTVEDMLWKKRWSSETVRLN